MTQSTRNSIILILILCLVVVGYYFYVKGKAWQIAQEGGRALVETGFPESSPADTGLSVYVYYYSPERDMDEMGNVKCSEQGLVPVKRIIHATETPIVDTLRLLLAGNLTQEEVASGIETEFPLSGVSLDSVSLWDGTLTLSFEDERGMTSGGSCRVSILWAQIRETALQFPEVRDVRFVPEYLFQP